MARITTYAIDSAISGKDKLVGSDAEDSNITKNYRIADLANYIGTSNTGAQGPEGPAGSNGTNGSDGTTELMDLMVRMVQTDLKVLQGQMERL